MNVYGREASTIRFSANSEWNRLNLAFHNFFRNAHLARETVEACSWIFSTAFTLLLMSNTEHVHSNSVVFHYARHFMTPGRVLSA